MKLKDYLDKFNLNPDITEAMRNIDMGNPSIDDYHYEEYDGKKFIVLTGTDNAGGTNEIIVHPDEVNFYGYSKGKTPKEDIPDVQISYGKDGELNHL